MTFHELNLLNTVALKQTLYRCCGSRTWVTNMLPFFPADDLVELLEDAEEQWFLCSKEDWLEAFSQHPRIGDKDSLQKKFASTAQWAAGEQGEVSKAKEKTLDELAEANRLYEEKFGYIFIVCATGKSAEEMLAILKSRLPNDPEKEILFAADEQNKITRLRLEKLIE
ncbi:MAG TPA: 2-oxo-4-hydroxy-4-carboxy-5-ureidoimidazoline decarboxylase [Chitinophagaceae bacterium]|nr:2-oxo-4-hydroxy-4-carboxy-5-ureidoimidazoline decarboxylase [Chitinophagaceae bacterium]